MLPLLLQLVAAPGAPADTRQFGHFAYPEAPAATLVAAPPGFGVGQTCRVAAAMMPDLARMVDAANAAGLGQTLHGVSCFRSIRYQQSVFCRRGCGDEATRAHVSAPPGHSEHATGYAIDFAGRPQRGCADVSPCFATTPAGQWLIANAPRFGFELSFPDGNAQGVSFEPWHWRWVGVNGDAAEAAPARALFAAARAAFPAGPAVPRLAIRVAIQPPLPSAR